MKCPSRKIRRNSYKTKKRNKVRTSCVKDRGRKGKTSKNRKVLPPLKDDIHLSKYGYSIKKTSEERRRALSKAVEKFRSDVEFMRDLYRQSKDRIH